MGAWELEHCRDSVVDSRYVRVTIVRQTRLERAPPLRLQNVPFFDTKFLVFNARFIVFDTKFLVLNTKFLIFILKTHGRLPEIVIELVNIADLQDWGGQRDDVGAFLSHRPAFFNRRVPLFSAEESAFSMEESRFLYRN